MSYYLSLPISWIPDFNWPCQYGYSSVYQKELTILLIQASSHPLLIAFCNLRRGLTWFGYIFIYNELYQNYLILTKHFYQYPSYKSPGISWCLTKSITQYLKPVVADTDRFFMGIRYLRLQCLDLMFIGSALLWWSSFNLTYRSPDSSSLFFCSVWLSADI